MKQNYDVNDFQQNGIIRSFGESIYNHKVSIVEVEKDQSNLLENLVQFHNRYRPKKREGRDKLRDTYESSSALFEARESMLLMLSKGGYFK